jgi:hypothetical protein
MRNAVMISMRFRLSGFRANSEQLEERAMKALANSNFSNAGRLYEKAFDRAVEELNLDSARRCAVMGSVAYEDAAEHGQMRHGSGIPALVWAFGGLISDGFSEREAMHMYLEDALWMLRRAHHLSSAVQDTKNATRISGMINERQAELTSLTRHRRQVP